MKKMTKLILLVLLFASFSIYAATRHYEAEGGFSYLLPEGWEVISFGDLKFKAAVTTPVNDFRPNMTFVDEKYASDLEAYRKANIPTMQESIPGFRIIAEYDGRTHQGRRYLTMTYMHKTESQGTIFQTAHFMELRGDIKLVATCTPPPGHDSKYLKVCTELVRSIRVD